MARNLPAAGWSLGAVLVGCAGAAGPRGAAPPAHDPHVVVDHTVVVDGAALVYHVVGRGPACIVQPGGPGLDWSYLRLPAELEEHLTLVYIEPAGTGASAPLPDGVAAGATADEARIDAVRADLGLDSVYVLGHSYGGWVAMQYAIDHAEHLGGLVLYGTSAVRGEALDDDIEAVVGSFVDEPWFSDAQNARFGLGDAPPHGNCPRLTAVAPFYFDDWTHRRAALEPLILALRCWDLPRAHDLLDDYRPALAGVTAPTLVIGGRRDWRFPIAWQRATADALPHATFVVVEHSGHLPHVEQPADFARAIIAWLPAAR